MVILVKINAKILDFFECHIVSWELSHSYRNVTPGPKIEHTCLEDEYGDPKYFELTKKEFGRPR